MENITILPSCRDCGRLLKKKDVNESGLCPKCLVKTAEGEVEVAVAFGIVPNLDVQSEKNDVGQDGINVNISEVQSEIELQPSDESTNEIITTEEHQPSPEFVKKEEIIESLVKPGQVIRSKFMELIAEDKITQEYIFELSTKEGTAKLIDVRYPFLLEYEGTKSIKEQAYIKGHSRYTSKPITIGDRQYLITNDIYAKTVPKFLEWSKSL